MTAPYDVVVAGGGPAGAVTAWVAARAGRSVLLLDRGGGRFRGGDALPPSAKPILDALDLEATLRDGPHLPCPANQSCWGADELGETDFLWSPWGHGWHLDREAFDAAQLERAEAAGVDVRRGAQVVGIADEDPWSVTWRAAGREASAHGTWLVDATGHARVLLRRLDIGVTHEDHQVARVGVFDRGDAEDEDTRTLIEAVPDGWWYTARVPFDRRLAVFFSDADLPGWQALSEPGGFEAALDATRYVGPKLRAGAYSRTLQLVTHPASTNRAKRWVGPHWVAVGDAAACWDPLSGQGVYTALRCGERAGRALDAALDGRRGELDRYAGWLEETWTTFCAERSNYYALEQRFADRPFWQRR